jgi:hypothetical protein
MKDERFRELVVTRLNVIQGTLASKAKEYASEDRLYNFKRAAEMSRTTPIEALKGMMLKHLVSVFDLMEGKLENTAYLVNEKVGDAINYLILLEALLEEKREPVTCEEKYAMQKCMECGDCSNGDKS